MLASASPRRKAALELLGVPFVCIPADVDETPPPGLSPREAAEALALRKALAVAGRGAPHRFVFAADTVVALDGEIVGAPADGREALEALRRLSGRTHEAFTAMALLDSESGKTDVRSASCLVEFAALSDEEARRYVAAGEWRGAAGGYRLQERGACLVKSVNGQPGAVVGLPFRGFCEMMFENGLRLGA